MRLHQNAGPATIQGMAKSYDEEALRHALQRFMEVRALNPFAWARAADVSDNALRNFLNRRSHTLTDKTLQKLAAAANATVAEISGHAPHDMEIPILGKAGAGDVVVMFDDEQEPIDYLPRRKLKRPGALIVQGDSMLPRYQDGDIIIFEQDEAPPDRYLGRDCVVALRNNQILLKRLLRGSRRGRYHLASINPTVPPLENQDVRWASRIKMIHPKDG